MSPADERLAAAVAGDRDALESLAAELLPRVRNQVRYLVRGDGDVDDIAQEALVTILQWLPTHRGAGTLHAWASKITTRVTFRYQRKRLRRSARMDDQADLAAVPDHPRSDDYATRRLAVLLLDQLPDEQRQALVMHHVLEWSVAEIAEELGVPFETVRSRLRVGMATLRSLHAVESS